MKDSASIYGGFIFFFNLVINYTLSESSFEMMNSVKGSAMYIQGSIENASILNSSFINLAVNSNGGSILFDSFVSNFQLIKCSFNN
jgi:hypothetical protein